MEKEKLQLLLELIIWADINWNDLRNVLIEKKYITEELAELVDRIVENLAKLEKEHTAEMKKWQNDFYALRNAFPDLIGDKEFVDVLKEERDQYEQTLNYLTDQVVKVWQQFREHPSFDLLHTHLFEKYKEAEFHFRRLNNLISLLEGTEKEGGGIEQYEERQFVLEFAKNNLDIKEVIEQETGKQFKKSGSVYLMNCPFQDHIDTNASFVVYGGQNHFYCFGCQRGGDIIAFLEYLYNMSFIKALDYVAEKYVPRTIRKNS